MLDTSVALKAVAAPELLSPRILRAIEQGPSFLSVIAYWEVMIKVMKGTLHVGDARQWWTDTLEALALLPLLFRPEHVEAIHNLPSVHQDPFDRAMIAQATVEDLTLLTTDGLIPRYASNRLRVMH